MLPGDHACVVYSGEDDRKMILGAYLRAGLDAGQRVAYLCGGAEQETEDWLCDVDHRVRRSVASGQLLLVGAGGAGPRHGAAAVEPRRTLASLQIMADEAMIDGYPALRVAAEGGYLIHGLQADAVLPFERDVTRLVEANRMLALCAYSTAHLPAPLVPAVIGGHPDPDPRAEYERAGLRITRTGSPPGIRLAGELDRRHLPAFAAALAALADSSPTVRLDMRSLTFIDLAALTAIANTAESLDAGGQVVLDSPPWMAERIIAKCWPGIPLPRLAIAASPRPRAVPGTTWTAPYGAEQPT